MLIKHFMKQIFISIMIIPSLKYFCLLYKKIMSIKCYKLPDYNWHSQCNEWSGLGLFTLSFTGIYSIPTLYKWVCQEPNCFTVDSNHITVFFLNKLIKDMIDISRYWRWRYQTDFHCYFFFCDILAMLT